MSKSTTIIAHSPRVPPVATPAGAADRALSGHRVMIVGVDAAAAGAIAAHLAGAGAEVRVCGRTGDAIDAWPEFLPHALVIETGLGGLDEPGLARWVREQPGGRVVLLAALSAAGDDPAVRASHAAGFDVHLRKPADLKLLTALVAGFGFKLRLDAAIPAS